MSNEVEWITSGQLLELWQRGGSGGDLGDRLRPGLKARLITARAKVAELDDGDRPKQTKTDWLVEPRVWKGNEKNSALILGRDYFHSTASALDTGYRSVKLYGLSFGKRETLQFAGLSEAAERAPQQMTTSAEQPSTPKRGGGKGPSKEDWTNFAAALATVASLHPDGLEIGTSASKIYERVAEVLQARLKDGASYMGKDNVSDAITLAQDWIRQGMPDWD